MDWPSLIGMMITTILGTGGIVAVLTTFLLQRRKQAQDAEMEQFKQAQAAKMELIPHLVDRLNTVEAIEQKCQEERTQQAKEIGAMSERIKHLEERAVTDMSFQSLAAGVLASLDKQGVVADAAFDKMQTYLNARVHDIAGPVQALVNQVSLLLLKEKTTNGGSQT